MTDTKVAIEAAMRRAAEAAAMAKANPAAAALGEFPGHNRSGTVSVWVDAIGRLVRLELAEGSVQEGEEGPLADAIAEAYVDAVKAASAFARQGFAEWAREQATAPQAPARRRRARDEDDDEAHDFLRDAY